LANGIYFDVAHIFLYATGCRLVVAKRFATLILFASENDTFAIVIEQLLCIAA